MSTPQNVPLDKTNPPSVKGTPFHLSSKLAVLFFVSSLLIFSFAVFKNEDRSFRKIISKILYTTPNGMVHQVLKIQTTKGISVEIYKLNANYPQLVSKFEVLGEKDGYFILGGSGTNLATFDIDYDLKQEILIPTFDHNLTAKLDIIKYDEAAQKFIIFEESSYSSY